MIGDRKEHILRRDVLFLAHVVCEMIAEQVVRTDAKKVSQRQDFVVGHESCPLLDQQYGQIIKVVTP